MGDCNSVSIGIVELPDVGTRGTFVYVCFDIDERLYFSKVQLRFIVSRMCNKTLPDYHENIHVLILNRNIYTPTTSQWYRIV